MNVGQRVELTAQVESLVTIARLGDQGTVEGLHADGYLTVRMDNGRPQFPCSGEVKVLPSPA